MARASSLSRSQSSPNLTTQRVRQERDARPEGLQDEDCEDCLCEGCQSREVLWLEEDAEGYGSDRAVEGTGGMSGGGGGGGAGQDVRGPNLIFLSKWLC